MKRQDIFTLIVILACCAFGVMAVLLKIKSDGLEQKVHDQEAMRKYETSTYRAALASAEDKITELENRPPEIVEVEKIVEVEVPVYVESEYHDIVMSADERELLARILALEAGDQPDVGERAVVEEIFNRVQSKDWPDSVTKVIYQKGQFEAVKYLDHPYMVPGEREYDNIDFVLRRGRTVLPEDYVYFATYKANGRDFIQIAGHYFGR